MTTEHELPADLDNYIAGLRIENINLKLAAKQMERALAGMLFAFDDGVGQTWSADVLDFARQLVKAKEFDASQQGEQEVEQRNEAILRKFAAWVDDEHPEQAEGAQGEREAFEAWLSTIHTVSKHTFARSNGEYAYNPAYNYWKVWQARAALAQPSPKPGELVVTRNEVGAIVAITRQDAEGRVLNVLAEAQPSTALELDYTHMSRRMLEELAKVGKCLVATADLERLTQERDAAQDRVAELEKQEPVAWTWQGVLDQLRRGDYLPEGVTVFPHRGPGVPLPLYAAQAGQVPEGWKVSLMGPDEVIRIERADGKWCGVTDLSDSPRDKLLYELLKPLAAAPAQGGE